jgi:hypothetical protein
MKNNKLIYGLALIFLAAVILYIGSDLSSRSFFRNGKNGNHVNVADSISIASIKSLTTDCNCDIELIESTEEKVVFFYDKKYHQNKSEYLNNELKVDFESKESNFLNFDNAPNIKVKVYCKSLEKITQTGVGDLTNKGTLIADNLTIVNEGVGDIDLLIKTGQLNVTNDGVGDINIKGEASASSIINEGTGNVDAEKLVSKSSKVINSGVGNVDVYASDTLNLTNSGVGDIDYSGTGVITSIITDGVGHINKK